MLKPGRKSKFEREVLILKILKGHENILNYYNVLKNPIKLMYTIISEPVKYQNFDSYFKKFTIPTLKTYMQKLITSLDYIHSKGIIHRDIKPQNILYDFENQNMKIIDFGLAEFYTPGTSLTPKVASLFYKAPELIIEYEYYNYGIDIWAAGIILASIVFQKHPFILGDNIFEQLIKIIGILGSDELLKFHLTYGLNLPEEFKYSGYKKKKFSDFVEDYNKHLVDDKVLDLIGKMLMFDPTKRITAKEALEHSFFK